MSTSQYTIGQIGAFGELQFVGTVNVPIGIDGGEISGLPFFQFVEIDRNGVKDYPRTNDLNGKYVPTPEVFPVRMGAQYSRFFALGASSYFSLGVGYSNYRTTFKFFDDNSENSLTKQHYLDFPIRIHLLSNKFRKQNPFQNDLYAAGALQRRNGGIEVSLGLRIQSPLASKRAITTMDTQFATDLNRIMTSLDSGFQTFILQPEITLSFALGGGVMFNFSGGYPLQPSFKTQTFNLLTTNQEQYSLITESTQQLQLSFSLSFRGGFKKSKP